MTSSVSQDRKSFLFFLCLVVGTACTPFLPENKPLYVGVLAVIWGFFGLFRLLYLSHYQTEDIPKILNLPIQILFGSSKQEQQKRKLILQRMAQPDVLLWLVGTIIFIIRMVYFYLYVGAPQSGITTTPYMILTQLSLYGIIVTLTFVALSYSQKRHHIRVMAMTISPLILLTLVMAVLGTFGAMMPAISQWGERYDALGFIGAYGLYVLAFPAIAMFTKILFYGRRTVLKPLLGLGGIILLLVMDRMVIASDWTSACSILLICAIALLWGHTIRYRL